MKSERKHTLFAGFALALGLPLVAFVLQSLFWPTLQPYVWFLFYPAVFFSSWVGGLPGGLGATVISIMLVCFYFIPPESSLATGHSRTILSVGVFMAMGVLFSFFHGRLRKTTQQATEVLAAVQSANDQLESRVRERTSELTRTNESLRASEADFRANFHSTAVGQAQVIADTGRYVRVNAKFCEITGYSEEELLRMTFLELIHPDDRPSDAAAHESMVRGEIPEVSREKRYVRKDGSVAWININASLIRDSAGRPLRTLAVVQDITERKRSEEEIRVLNADMDRRVQERTAALLKANETLADFKAALDEHAIVAITDARGKITYVNDKFCAISKYSREELIGQDHRIVNSGHHPKVFISELWQTITSGRVWKGEIKNRAKDGSFYWVATTIVPFLGADGKPSQFIAIRADITERKQAEEALRYSQRRLRLALEAAQLGDWELDLVTQTARRSLRHDQIFGYAELLPEWSYPLFLKHVHPEDRARVDRAFQESVAAGRDWYFECRISRADQTVRWIWARGSIFKDQSGQPTEMLGMVGDITERKEAEAAIQRLNAELRARAAQLEAANKELESFAYSVSHDLRAPLRGMDGFSQAILEDYAGQLDATGQDYLRRIRAGAQRMGQLIDDLLNLSQVTRSEMALDPVNLTALARKVIAELQPQQAGRAVQWEVSDPLTGRGDLRLLQLVLENLLANALKFTGKCEHARIEFDQQVHGAEQAFFVRDNGAGFDMAYSNRLFGAFQRLHSPQEFPGTGVGLATVQRIIHRHGGRVWAEAQPGKGATFYFTLPTPN